MNEAAPQPTPANAEVLCYHCGLPVIGVPRYSIVIDGGAKPLCCPACQAVAETIIAGGFDSYYRFRTAASAQPADDLNALSAAFALYDQAEFQQQWLTPLADGLVEGEWLIGGMHCAACVWLLENYLRRVPGIVAVQINLIEQRAYLRWQASRLPPSTIGRAIAALGYQPQPYSSDRAEQLRHRDQRQALRRLGVAGLGMMQVGMCALGLYAGAIDGIEPIYRDFLRWISLIVSIPMVFYCGQPFFIGAWRGVKMRQPGMDVPVALAIALAFSASVWATVRGTGEVYFDSVSMFIFLLLASRYLEMRARHFSGRLSTDLLSLLPRAATRIDNNGGAQPVPVAQLAVGDTVLVGDGQTLPADGYLLDPHASLNEAALTGEFMAVPKYRGDLLLAGSINGAQPLTMTVNGVGQQLRLAAIHALSRRAQTQKPRLAQLADRIATHFVVTILLLAAATYAAWWWLDPTRAFWIALSVLVVSCPCALSLATPAVIANATQNLRRRGLLVTRADAWEKIPTITDIVFDKTGTLTAGSIRIVTALPCRERSAAIYLDIAAALEVGSSHPIARAFANRTATPALERKQHTGRGVEGFIAAHRYRLGQAEFALQLCGQKIAVPAPGHWILLADDSEPLCWFRLDDQLRDDTASAIAALQQRGLQLHVLSGDNSDAVATVAAQLHIQHSTAGATPEQKLRYIEALQQQGRRVLMVGDGINDIPVLAAADVSVAMSNASELAKTHADCILLTPQLNRLPALFAYACTTRLIIRQNLAWALVYNAVAVPLAAFGLVAPWQAAVGMSLSSLLVVGNALRLRRIDDKTL